MGYKRKFLGVGAALFLTFYPVQNAYGQDEYCEELARDYKFYSEFKEFIEEGEYKVLPETRAPQVIREILRKINELEELINTNCKNTKIC